MSNLEVTTKRRTLLTTLNASGLLLSSCNMFGSKTEFILDPEAVAVYPAEISVSSKMKWFGKRHKTCPMWTDWQTLCSRLDDDKVWCQLDASMPVEPSEPFCVEDYVYDPPELSQKQLKSATRFCEKIHKRKTDKVEYIDDQGGAVFEHIDVCYRYSDTRPFNGYSQEALKHPWCSRWEKRAPGGKGCGVSDGNEQNCGTPDAYCAAKVIPEWCEEAYASTLFNSNLEVEGGYIVIFGTTFYLPNPVYGMHCAQTIKGGR